MGREIRIGVCTSCKRSNIEALMTQLALLANVAPRFVELPYNDLDTFSLVTLAWSLDAVILCHSINNRRFAITDVADSLYNRFLPHASSILGKDNTIVIAHDFPQPTTKPGSSRGKVEDDRKRKALEDFRAKQPTTFSCSSLVLMCGMMDDRVDRGDGIEIDHDDWQLLKEAVAKMRPRSTSSKTVFVVIEIIKPYVGLLLRWLILPFVMWFFLKVFCRIVYWVYVKAIWILDMIMLRWLRRRHVHTQ